MKKLFLFLAMASTTMFVSCGSDDSDNNGPTEPVATSITLSASLTTIEVGQSVTLTVTDNLTNNVTGASTFTANGVALAGPTFTGATAGTFSIVAKNGDLTSAAVVITVTAAPIEADNSFVIDNVNYETPDALFQYLGIAEVSEGSYVIGWAFNPFKEVMVGENPTYPNDMYVYALYPITPSGTDPETGEPTFTIQDPTTGSFTYDPDFAASSVFDVQFFADSETAYLPTVAAERAALISAVTLDIPTLDLVSEVTNVDATYTITLTDGTVVEGDYSGETGVYGLPQARGTKSKKLSTFSAQDQKVFKTFARNNLKK